MLVRFAWHVTTIHPHHLHPSSHPFLLSHPSLPLACEPGKVVVDDGINPLAHDDASDCFQCASGSIANTESTACELEEDTCLRAHLPTIPVPSAGTPGIPCAAGTESQEGASCVACEAGRYNPDDAGECEDW